MALPALVLVHGGGLAADSWDLTVDEIHRLAPELTVLALDMPERRGKPGDLRELTIADYVDSLFGDIESAGLDDIVIVGHSVAGVMVPGVVTKLGAARVREMVLAAAFVPPEGAAIADTITGPAAPLARRGAKTGRIRETPKWLVTSPRKRPGCPSGLDAAGSGNGPVSPLSQPFSGSVPVSSVMEAGQGVPDRAGREGNWSIMRYRV